MDATTLILALVLVAAGLVIGFLLGRSQARSQAGGQQAELARAKAERDASLARLEALTNDRTSMAHEFQRLSATAAEQQAATVDRTAKARFDQTRVLLEPISRSLQAMNDRLLQVERDRAQGAADLRRQVAAVASSSESLRKETAALVTALRQPQVRGAWGETQLKRVVEIAGLVERCDFDTQVAVATEDGGLRPDMRVNMADGKVIFVDAKTPLGNFIDAFATDDPDRRTALLGQYVKNVTVHINQLGAKNYWRLDAGSPEMVVLFLPSDALLQVALDQRPDLHEYAANHSIFLASPSILIPMLRAVQHGWKQAAFTQSAQEVAALGSELYQRLATMSGHVDKLGRSLSGAVEAYNKTVGSLEQRVLVSARRINELQLAEGSLETPRAVRASPRVMTAPELVSDEPPGADDAPGTAGAVTSTPGLGEGS
ncbi:MAG: DNA recombination protein RmuC [Propionibacteriaceae bacterium]|uniref:DNA recombination RmuC n=1 Tax=Propionibacterium ruminifibrarum TaxID=1962131 RepID=A0A375I379_9ACTN|nr:DNA recombination protein RmuC [Propionibacterium ruminifibrarum]MBE6477184.1 DNA recombination protein RmuC [Propionibacteriaceae bacterium]SPF68588.1 DNA recombination RmuC [Propionibacterium ruminifibrarum]